MDALSYVLANIRLISPLLAKLRLGRNVSVAMDGEPAGGLAASFHYIERGQCILATAEDTIVLNEGDMVLLPRWPAYRLESGKAARTISIAEVAAEKSGASWTLEKGIDVPLDLQAGEAPYDIELLGGIFAFDNTRAALILRELPDFIHMNARREHISAPLKAALEFARDDGKGRLGYTAVAQRLLEALLIEIVRTWALDSDHAPGRLRGVTDPTLAPALYAIHSRPGHKWTLEALASLAGRSRSSFAAHFAATVGMPPAVYVAEWRCQIAERRIAEGESTAEIAYDLGYESSFAFARMFQRMRGMTPRRYRTDRHGQMTGAHTHNNLQA